MYVCMYKNIYILYLYIYAGVYAYRSTRQYTCQVQRVVQKKWKTRGTSHCSFKDLDPFTTLEEEEEEDDEPWAPS